MIRRRIHRLQARCLLPLLLLIVPHLRAQPFTSVSTQDSGDTHPLAHSAWKTDIIATVFWVGEPAKGDSPSNASSSWDHSWMTSFGGFDDPDPAKRASDFRPTKFIPGQNPFYVALPYNDCVDATTTKDEAAKVVPWFSKSYRAPGKSVCQNRWIAIRYGPRTCYAQWSDCGPFVTNDASYVFGNARPKNSKNSGAGLDLAPAVRDFLRFSSGEKVDWRFVELANVPDGPWKRYGVNNHFSRDAAKNPDLATDKNATASIAPNPSHAKLTGDARLEELRRQRDQWLKASGR
jgi:hypothetical protein